MVGMSQEQSALFWQSLTWKFVLGSGLVKESICHTSPSLLQTLRETCRRIARLKPFPRVWSVGLRSGATGVARLENAFPAQCDGRVALPGVTGVARLCK